MRNLYGTIFAAGAGVAMAGGANMGLAGPVRSHAFKTPSKMEMLRLGEVKPQGWLRDWCIAARNGYISRMDEIDQAFQRAWNSDFHPRGKYLDWTDPDKGAWCTEGGAYWFEGLVRLAWELDDEELKAYAKKRLEPLLEHMNPNAIGFVYWMDRNDPAHWGEIENANHGFIVGASARTCRSFLAYYEATGRDYETSRKLADAVRRLSGRALPAYVNGCPDLYVMVKRDGAETVIGLWNMFADSVLDGVVELDAPAGDVEFFNCTGRKDGDRLVIDEIPPFSFAGIRNRAEVF